jgi:hypothetical protein
MVVERPGVTEEDLRDAVFDWLDRTGWIELFEETAIDRAADDDTFDPDDDVDDLIEAVIDEHVECIHEVCATYPIGTVVVRRGNLVMTRSFPTAA